MTQQLEELGFTCGACGKQFRWKPELAGRSVKCKCESTIRVPAQAGGVAQPKSAAAATPAAPVGPRPSPGSSQTAGASRPSPANVQPAGAARQSPAGTQAARPRAASATAAPPPARPAPPAPPPPPADDDPFAALNALAEQEAAIADGAADADAENRCPNCRGFLSPAAVLCTNCGFDRRKGKVLAAATAAPAAAAGGGSGQRGLFGFGKPKPADPSKNKPVDHMAPQGSFVVGLGVSVALAALAGAAWFGVAYGTGIDIYYLVILIGVAAGFGMQVGQRGYSSLGGLAAVGIALAVILAARAAVVMAVVMPLTNIAADSGEDPRIVFMLVGAEFQERGIDPEKTTVRKFNEVKAAAVRRARLLSADEKRRLIAAADAEGFTTRDIEAATAEASSPMSLVVFGGVKPVVFLVIALGIAFRTASGSVSG
jgi:hypothetical protein